MCLIDEEILKQKSEVKQFLTSSFFVQALWNKNQGKAKFLIPISFSPLRQSIRITFIDRNSTNEKCVIDKIRATHSAKMNK
jgi:hypothetical protein